MSTSDHLLNPVTTQLAPYPMEELSRIKSRLVKAGIKVFDFGTGDPQIPVWLPLVDAMKSQMGEFSSYPSIRGTPQLEEAHLHYLKARFGIENSDQLIAVPSKGSKESIFHIALSLIGRAGKRTLIYGDPAYPVYRSSALFAGGIPYPVTLNEEDGYQLEPWKLPLEVQNDAAAIWVNYPHNPTGATVSKSYWLKLIDWCHEKDCILLSDDCYVDIYDSSFDEASHLDLRPQTPLMYSTDRVLSFMSLSKRSGLTGYRAGMIAGDRRILEPHLRARANFGVACPSFVQHGAALAWKDDQHVAKRRKIFTERVHFASEALTSLGIEHLTPKATFYIWAKVPKTFVSNDVQFCLDLADRGVITSPSQWLGEKSFGYFRLALVPEINETKEALNILANFIGK